MGLDEGDAEHVNGELVQKIYFLKQEISKKLSYFYLLSVKFLGAEVLVDVAKIRP